MIGLGVGVNRRRFAGGFAGSYSSRVIAGGGTIEALDCVAAASSLLQSASLLLIPSGYKAGVAYAELPSNGNGDLTWSRNSLANRTQSDGNIGSVAANVPRLSYMYGSCPALLLEPQRTNSLRNSTMQGASTSPSTLPTNWAIAGGGLTGTVVGVGTENGLPYVDVNFSGTATNTDTSIRFESTTQIVASSGQTWANTLYAKLISASSPPLSYNIGFYQRTSTGTFVNIIVTPFTPTSTLTRVSNVVTITDATVARVQPTFIATITNGASYDFTIRIAAPQMELGAFATTWINTTNAAATRLADTFTRNNIYTNGIISSSGGTWFVELRNNVAYVRDNTGGLEINNVGGTSRIIVYNVGGNSRLSIFISGNGVVFNTTTDNVKLAIKWNGTTADVFVNGIKVASNLPYTTTLLQNLLSNTGVPFFIQAMALYPTPLSDSDCTTLTT